MSVIKLFIASSHQLSSERIRIELVVSRLSDKLFTQKRHYIKTQIWEKESRGFNTTRKQDDFNKLVIDSDIFFLLVGDKIGQYTFEEFHVAWDSLNRQGATAKRLIVFFKNLDININEIDTKNIEQVKNLKKNILEKEQFFYDYKTLDELELYVTKEISDFIETLPQPIISKFESFYACSEIDLLDNTGRLAILRKTQILKILEPTQFLDDYIISEGKIDIESINFEQGVLSEINQDLSRVFLKIDMGRVMNSGDFYTFIYSCTLIDSFTKDTEFWEHEVMSQNHINKIKVIFPENRPYIKCDSELRRNFHKMLSEKPISYERMKRSVIELENIPAQQYDRIRLKWSW